MPTSSPSAVPVDLEQLRSLARTLKEIDITSSRSATTKSETAYRVLETLITVGELPPGAHLTVEEFCDVLALGRSPTRDALKRLEVADLVDLRRRRGVQIRIPEHAEMAQALEVRGVLEHLATEQAIRAGSPAQKRLLAELGVALLQAAGDMDTRRFMHLGYVAYKHMTEATGNRFLGPPLMSTFSISRRIYFAGAKSRFDVVEIGKLHNVRFQAIARSEIENGKQATQALLTFLHRYVEKGKPANVE